MRWPVRCEAAQRAIGEAMDERRSLRAEVESHRRGCRACTAFAQGAWRVREVARFEVAPPVPDLVPAIMRRVETEARRRPLRRPVPSQPLLRGRRRVAVLALAAGLVIGFVFTSGGLIPTQRTDREALADEIPRHLVRAAATLEGYRATFEITEHHWTRSVPLRTFVADVAFLAPEAFRVRVRDTTDYPSNEWPRNDLLLVTDGKEWRAVGPDPCPQAALPACPREAPAEHAVSNRAPFDSRTPMPTDVIVPMTVLAASSRVEVTASGAVADRDAVAIELSYQEAAPLFDYLRFLGSWRPFFPQDRVVLWLDEATWFPLRYDVFPAQGAERSLWAAGAGLPAEDPDSPVFTAVARPIDTERPPAQLFVPRLGRQASDQGFRESGGSADTVQPGVTAGLSLWRAGRYERTAVRPYDLSISAYAKGLTWLTVTQVRRWNQPHLFGVGPFAEEVRLGPGTGYYEPASTMEPRRVALHTAMGEVLIATNLPRATLLSVATSLPVTGVPRPARWGVHRGSNSLVKVGLSPEEAIAESGFEVMVPTVLPPGYRAVSAATVRSSKSEGITIVYRQRAAELGGDGLRLYQSTGETLPPPTAGDEQVVPMDGITGRWSPQAHTLDWVDAAGVYRSLSGPAFDLTTLLEVAESLRPSEGAGR
jgi:outer membrane lipoprotein-sorting protein